MDRRAIFTPAFNEFLATQQRTKCQEQKRQRFKQEDGSFKYHSDEWTDVMEPSYTQEVIPSTLTEADIHADRWPIAYYRFTLANGQVIETFAQQSRDFHSQNLTVDFMGLRRIVKNGDPIILDELSWTPSEINEYVPRIAGNRQGQRVRGLEVTEPEAVGA